MKKLLFLIATHGRYIALGVIIPLIFFGAFLATEIKACEPPTVINLPATNITKTSVTLNCEVTDAGEADPEVSIFWQKGYDGGTDPANWNNFEELVGTWGIGPFSKDINDLEPSTTYYYRCVGSNEYAGGDVDWADDAESFTTLPRNVWGWAWSENIGWISFTFENCDSDHDGQTDTGNYSQCSTGESIGNYGVDIDEITGEFSGYTWSENIGWISFAPPGPYPTAPNYSAKVDTTTGQVSGWARALTYGGGWDGWIKLRDTDYSVYGVWIDSSTNPSEFKDWAWGGDDTTSTAVVGWMSFNHLNCDSDNDGFSDQGNFTQCPVGDTVSDYKVMTTLSFNQPPYVEFGSATTDGEGYCGILPETGQVNFKWTYQDIDGDDQSNYWLQIATDSGYTNKRVNCVIPQVISASSTGSAGVRVVSSPTPGCGLEIGYRGPGNFYYWRIKVQDEPGNWSQNWEEGNPFETPSHAKPWPDFTHTPQNPSVGEIVEFIDNSKCYSLGNIEYDCQTGGVSIQYEWDFDYIEAEGFTGVPAQKGNVTTTYSTSKNYEVRLRITDNTLSPPGVCIGKGDSPVGSTLPLPEWIEIPPFIWLNKFLAIISELFNSFIK